MTPTMTPARLLESAPCAPGVLLARFERPGGFAFEPGQHVLLGLETAEGPQVKPFTIACAPADATVDIATRLTGSAFKDALATLHLGDRVSLSEPLGRRALPAGTAKALFLAGGVGITPARAVLRDAAASASGLDAVLVYGNRDQSNVPFDAELAAMEAADPRLRVVRVMSQPLDDWGGETGHITADLVRRLVPDFAERHTVITGPPAMVEAMTGVTAELGVPGERTTVERFAGYR